MRHALYTGCLVTLVLTGGCCVKPASDRQIVNTMVEARQTRQPMAAPLGTIETLELERAYTIQRKLIDRLTRRGERLVGYKVGYTTEQSQQAWGISDPAYGPLFASMRVGDGGTLNSDAFLMFHIEAEVAFVLARDITTKLASVEEARRAVATAHAALDIPNNRFTPDAEKSIGDVVADGVGAWRYAIGPGHRPDAVDVDAVEARLVRNGKVIAEAPATDAMGSPYAVLQWLANDLIDRGRPLRAGDVVLTGSLGGAYVADKDKPAAGDYAADLGPLGRVRVTVE